jgi:iron complex transport system ATP-binding protein
LFKKVLLAFAMTREAPLLLLDNPAEGLDPAGIIDLERGLKRYTENGNSAVITTHDLNFASRISDQIILMHDGSIHCDGNYTVLTEENIRECFEIDCVVNKNIYNGKPEVLFIPQL